MTASSTSISLRPHCARGDRQLHQSGRIVHKTQSARCRCRCDQMSGWRRARPSIFPRDGRAPSSPRTASACSARRGARPAQHRGGSRGLAEFGDSRNGVRLACLDEYADAIARDHGAFFARLSGRRVTVTGQSSSELRPYPTTTWLRFAIVTCDGQRAGGGLSPRTDSYGYRRNDHAIHSRSACVASRECVMAAERAMSGGGESAGHPIMCLFTSAKFRRGRLTLDVRDLRFGMPGSGDCARHARAHAAEGFPRLRPAGSADRNTSAERPNSPDALPGNRSRRWTNLSEARERQSEDAKKFRTHLERMTFFDHTPAQDCRGA